MTTIGHNAPPVEAHGMNINDLYDEAKHWLDGSGVNTPEDAAGVATLLNHLRKARRAADDQRKVEKAPHDEAAKAVQAAWVPLLSKCDLAVDACKQALTPYQLKLEAEQRAAADAAAREAEAARLAAIEARQSAAPNDLIAREAAEQALKDADTAERVASKADRVRPTVAGEGRGIGLRTSYRGEITDMPALGKWAWANCRSEYEAFLNDLAEREARTGRMNIPGLKVHIERKAA